jgi:hypothetical protein
MSLKKHESQFGSTVLAWAEDPSQTTPAIAPEQLLTITTVARSAAAYAHSVPAKSPQT